MLNKLRLRVRAIFSKAKIEDELEDEVRFHLEREVEENIARGMNPEEARFAALRSFGGVERVKEESRDERGVRLVEELWHDLRYGLRLMLKQRIFTAVALLTLALGIGANTAIFSVVNAVLLRSLPYPEPDRLMMVFPGSRQNVQGRGGGRVFGPDFAEWRRQCKACEQMAAYTATWPSNLTGGTEPDRVRVARVSESLFATLGVQPILGRTFLPEEKAQLLFSDDRPVTGNSAVILGYSLWQRRFGADPAVIGRTVKVEGDNCTVVGVMPDGFNFPNEADAWLPAEISAKRDNSYLLVIARLRSGVTQVQAHAELETIARRLKQEFPGKNQVSDVYLVPLQEYVVGNVRLSLLIFLGAVGFVLLIACANVASLQLARAAARQKEMAIRTALGASRLRIVRQSLTESLLLALLGGSLGLGLAFWILNLLVAAAPQEIPRLNTIGIDRWVFGFTLLISVLTGVIFGLAPALQTSKPDLNASLKESGAQMAGIAIRHRLRGLLVIVEVSLALILLIGAGLLFKSFVKLRETALGFNPERVLTAAVTLPKSAYPTTAHERAYYQQALARLAATPEAQAVSVASWLPLSKNGAGVSGSLRVEGESEDRRGAWANKLAVSADYFRAMVIPLLKGRAFNEHDTSDSPGVLIISQALARHLWPNEDALGKRLNIGFGGETWREIVGVVGDVRQRELDAAPSQAVYQPYLQVADSRRWMLSDMTFVIRTAADPQNFTARLRSELQAVDQELPLYDVFVMEQVIARKITDQRFYMLLLTTFSALALSLAAAGIYGLISYSVSRRTHEIGIRIALGARAGDVLALIVKEGMKLVLVGLTIGLAGALALTRLLSRFLYQVSVTDPATFALLSLLFIGVALLACYFPARRATRVDPLIAIRSE